MTWGWFRARSYTPITAITPATPKPMYAHSGAFAASPSTVRPMMIATIGSMTVSPAITRSGGPEEYAVCTKYAPTAAAEQQRDEAASVSHSKSPDWMRLMTTFASVATKPYMTPAPMM